LKIVENRSGCVFMLCDVCIRQLSDSLDLASQTAQCHDPQRPERIWRFRFSNDGCRELYKADCRTNILLINEFVFRFDGRKSRGKSFLRPAQPATQIDPVLYKMISQTQRVAVG